MNFTEYQNLALATAIYPKKYETIYPALGLCGEAGEVAEKIKKSIRDGLHNWPDEQFKEELTKELGDVLWYISALASDLDISLNEIAESNLLKLASRKKRNVIGGSGDNR
jgi:NTP pyrophosphatase (non-canonical NTP hydrolase)